MNKQIEIVVDTSIVVEDIAVVAAAAKPLHRIGRGRPREIMFLLPGQVLVDREIACSNADTIN